MGNRVTFFRKSKTKSADWNDHVRRRKGQRPSLPETPPTQTQVPHVRSPPPNATREAGSADSGIVQDPPANGHSSSNGSRRGPNNAPVSGGHAPRPGGHQSSGSGGGGTSKIMVALYPYTAREDSELTFAKGDRLLVVKQDDPDWFLCRKTKTDMSSADIVEEGYVPVSYVASESLEGEEWFFGKISRNEASRLLLLGTYPRGTYLVRCSEGGEGGYSLSVRTRDPQVGEQIKHYRIRFSGARYAIASNRTFATLQGLLDYYHEAPNGLCTKLTQACSKKRPWHWPNREDEINQSDLRFVKKLGGGNFGEVHLCYYKGNVEVAVKTLKPGTMTPNAFLQEAAIMRKCRHPKLVSLLGVCSRKQPLCIVAEYMANGSLLDYLSNSSEGKRLVHGDLMDIAAQVASGMSYLESQKLIHRDLAARNILVGYDKDVKVADFGMARIIEDEEYMARQGAKFPIKWTSPEAALYGKFSLKSDVWSFGVLLYEIVTRGQKPYPGMDNREVIEQVSRGYRMPKPLSPDCTDTVYGMMMRCWDTKAEERPTFEFLFKFFEALPEQSEYMDAEDIKVMIAAH